VKRPIPFGKYYLLERINVGGMAEVFRAKAYGVEGFERLVAVKRILPNIAEDRDFITMFVDEAKIAVQLNHANVAQIFDLGVVDGAYYIALEHIHGRDLRAIFDRCRQGSEPMPIAQACFVLMKVCEGLDYAHNKRDQSGRELHLVHRDVSPQNVLVSFEGEVKIIDFGIAKAAGKGAKTQAGILKGKFGYMSPEQVRGLPIDRRSDIFSCGIVLYELLTGERLFVGESDFSTLEKVRNVEILPPSTYNRKIPDELERIVLKALAKDVEDRYQNAIDLHDELQAFVYTAGEFYSRKDLASWMKKVFTREIEAETAKLEQFRQIPAPQLQQSAQQAPLRSTTLDERGGRRPTLAMPSMAPPKPPPPPSTNGRPSSSPAADLEWDDDELETQIYDGQDEGTPAPLAAAPVVSTPAPSAGRPSPSQTLMGTGQMEMPEAPRTPPDQPDLRSLVRSSSEWPNQRGGAPPVNTPPPNLANGSNNTPSPFATEPSDPTDVSSPPPQAEDPSAVVRLVQQSQQLAAAPPIFESGFAAGIEPQHKPRKTGLIVAIVAAVLLLAGGGVGLKLYLDQTKADGDAAEGAAGVAAADPGNADSETPGMPAVDPAGPGAPAVDGLGDVAPAPPGGATDMDTGFDVIVDPQGAGIKLDGSSVGPAPRRVRNIAAGTHVLEIEAPGFFAKREEVEVVAGKAEVVRITLDPIDIIGRFTSEPPGARVTLVSDGKKTKLGTAPAEVKLDPRKRYEVMFKKPGYVTVTKPVALTGQPDVNVAVVMERSGGIDRAIVAQRGVAKKDDAKKDDDGRRGSDSLLDGPKKDPPKDPPKKDPPKKDPDPPVAAGPPGKLLLGSKPPCAIYIDGKDTGLKTPQRGLELSPGKHKITLVNNEFKIKETIRVTVKSGEEKKIIKDFSDRLK
jgi:serine/threonine protein kinase